MYMTTVFLALFLANGTSATEAKPDDGVATLQLRVFNLETRVQALTTEVAVTKAEAKAARARADEAYEEAQKADRYHNGIGLGVLVPKGSGSTQFGMNANLHWLTAQWVPAAGIGFGLAPTIELYQRVRLRIFDLGVFYNYKNPLTVPDISRKLDLTLATGLDIRVWKGIALHAQVGWFLPNPVSLYDAGKAKYDSAQKADGNDVGKTIGSINTSNPVGAVGQVQSATNQAQSTVDNAKSAWDYALNGLKRALNDPMITVAIDWQF
jgi:outer membrane murein-binding lipoprotein Lpp